jgi:hypothetical protein
MPKERDLREMLTSLTWKEGDQEILKPGPQALAHLKTALEWADKAFAICEQVGLCSLVPDVRHRQAAIHAAAGERVRALQSQIEVVLAWTDVPGNPDPPLTDLGNVAARYWNLRTVETLDHPGKVGGSDTWEDSESWQHRRSTPTSCVNAR